jgi:hypothetical protein
VKDLVNIDVTDEELEAAMRQLDEEERWQKETPTNTASSRNCRRPSSSLRR